MLAGKARHEAHIATPASGGESSSTRFRLRIWRTTVSMSSSQLPDPPTFPIPQFEPPAEFDEMSFGHPFGKRTWMPSCHSI